MWKAEIRRFSEEEERPVDRDGRIIYGSSLCVALGSVKIHPFLYFLLQSFWSWQILATKSLKTESMKVYKALKTGSLEDGRKAVSMIVGRDTDALSREGVVKATVETVAENTSDGL